MSLSGEEIASALKKWAVKEIEALSDRGYDLGKFAFTVTAASTGVVVSVEKLTSPPGLDRFLLASISLFFLSILITIDLLRPRKRRVRSTTDLHDEYEEELSFIYNRLRGWFVIWTIGIILGGVAVYR